MRIKSDAFNNDELIPSRYTCDGLNVSPPLEFFDIPEETKSLVLFMEDPDVPKNLREDGMWDHWIVFNMSANTRKIAEGEIVPGTVGINTSGKNEYNGPCPPDREHRYFFKLFALDISLDLDNLAMKTDVEDAMKDHILVSDELIGRYERQEKLV